MGTREPQHKLSETYIPPPRMALGQGCCPNYTDRKSGILGDCLKDSTLQSSLLVHYLATLKFRDPCSSEDIFNSIIPKVLFDY